MNNNILKSVVFAAVVLIAGIVAMQVIYNNVTGDADRMAGYEPAAGEEGMEAEGEVNYQNNETFADDLEDAGDAIARDTEKAAEAIEEGAEEAVEEVDEAAHDMDADADDEGDDGMDDPDEADNVSEEETAE